jgi:hypothetical protein
MALVPWKPAQRGLLGSIGRPPGTGPGGVAEAGHCGGGVLLGGGDPTEMGAPNTGGWEGSGVAPGAGNEGGAPAPGGRAGGPICFGMQTPP